MNQKTPKKLPTLEALPQPATGNGASADPAQHCAQTEKKATAPRQFPALALETRPNVDTATAAHWLWRTQQTLRCWSCHESGPLRPIRINGRLAWPVSEIRRVLEVAA